MKWFNGRFMRNLLGLVPRLRSCGGPRTRGYTQSGIISEDPLFSTFCVVGFGVAVARVDSEDTLDFCSRGSSGPQYSQNEP